MTVTTMTPGDRVHANAATLRLRSLVALGHSAQRIARALGEPDQEIRRLINGKRLTTPRDLNARVSALWEAWWCLKPPQRTSGEKGAATQAMHRAAAARWCCPAGLDEDELDSDPRYQPGCGWRYAEGLGVADDDPLGLGCAA
jgi:hypothetical protein